MIITFLSDFGTADYFAGAMKGAALSVDPSATVVDITHEIPPHDITGGAFTLAAAYPTFPAGSVHVAVVDPGVGSDRRPIAVAADGHFFVGPDNGLFSLIFDRDPACRVFHLANRGYFREPVSFTFHGRDIFAPVGGALSRGEAIETFGPEITDWVVLPMSRPLVMVDGVVVGAILHTDRFGNCVTNIRREHVEAAGATEGFTLEVGLIRVNRTLTAYSDTLYTPEPFAIWGSAGFVEVSVRQGSAADLLGIRVGDRVTLRGVGR
jgi:S-adenosylmethionine hydrolase